MSLYSVLVQPLADALGIGQIEFRWIVLTKTKQPSVTCHMAKPDPTAVRRVLGTVRQVWRAIRNELLLSGAVGDELRGLRLSKRLSAMGGTH